VNENVSLLRVGKRNLWARPLNQPFRAIVSTSSNDRRWPIATYSGVIISSASFDLTNDSFEITVYKSRSITVGE